MDNKQIINKISGQPANHIQIQAVLHRVKLCKRACDQAGIKLAPDFEQTMTAKLLRSGNLSNIEQYFIQDNANPQMAEITLMTLTKQLRTCTSGLRETLLTAYAKGL